MAAAHQSSYEGPVPSIHKVIPLSVPGANL